MRSIATVLGLLCLASTAADAAFVVSKDQTSNVDCSGGICTSTAADAVLNVGDLRAHLRDGDLTLRSTSDSQGIVVAANLTLTGRHGLVLDSWAGIDVTGAVSANGRGAVTLITKDGGADGNITFSDKGRLTFKSMDGQLFINGKRFVLVDSLAALATAAAGDPQAKVALAADIDASGDGTYGLSPVTTTFAGTFEGLGHVVDRMTIDVADANQDAGLFRELGDGATVRNLTFTTPSVSRDNLQRGNRQHIASLAALSAADIRNVVVRDANILIRGAGVLKRPVGCAGGLVGTNSGTVNRAQVLNSTVAARGEAGGIACESSGTIVSSGTNATVASGVNAGAGGVVFLNTGTVSLSWSAGHVSSTGAYRNFGSSGTGGLVAVNTGSIDTSWSSAPVDAGAGGEDTVGDSYAYGGGLAASNQGTIRTSYALGRVVADYHGSIGGLVYTNAGTATIDQSYTVSRVACHDPRCAAYAFVGPACSNGTADYWDTTTAGEGIAKECTGLTGLTDAELKSGLPAGFDPAVWGQSPGINDGYPYLLANPPR